MVTKAYLLNKVKTAGLLTMSSLLFVACNDFLDKEPDDRVELSTEDQVVMLLSGAYPDSNYGWFCELSSDNVMDLNSEHYPISEDAEQKLTHYNLSTSGRQDDEAYLFQPVKSSTSSDTPGGMWSSTYITINTVNEILAAIDNLSDNGRNMTPKLAAAKGKTVQEIKDIINGLHEFNPMMGHRGCRLAVTYPEIAAMQTKAVIRAAIEVQKEHPEWKVVPEIMIPLVGDVKELKYVKKTVVATADAEVAASGIDLKYEVGTMIEIPRACLTADKIAANADFFCFGTNDLTQMTFGFSRDDSGKFLNAYYDAKIFENDPFAKLDQEGVGKLMKMAIDLGKPVNPNLHIGICGEHGGDPSSVEFCHKIGLNYVSCSPFRVPVARLAAAQAAIADKK